ncbi:MAG: hydrogenase iron-sulfur subunit [Acidimicrobiia bacterium]|nr:hydrogenase iron-sulfur subunit [Acidimicrobiia bacterium]
MSRRVTNLTESIDWDLRQDNPVRKTLNLAERFSLAVERPIDRLVRLPQLNPLYHTGTITIFLLIVLTVTGLYLTLFYQFGTEASYEAVVKIEANWIGRIMRALHRYASPAVLVTSLLHGWRTLFMDRFRGPRWLAWVTGVVMTWFIWIIGVTGYWLIFDERAQVITQTLIRAVGDWPTGVAFLINNAITSGAGTGWVFVVLVITVHIGLSLLLILFIWYHVKRLSRPKILPPRYWMGILLGLLVGAAIAVPVGMLPRIDPGQIPRDLTIDWFYLFYLPAGLNWPPLLLWGGGFVLLVAASLIPWLAIRKPLPSIVVHEDLCTGCGLCPPDCPYRALEMVDTPDRHHRQLAVVDPLMCVACGVCVGSCPEMALTLGDRPAGAIWSETRAAVSGEDPVEIVFTCERHAYHGARPYLQEPHFDGDQRIVVVPVTCVGMIHPRLAQEALDAGASAVRVIGCPPEDCTNREGNLWLSERIERKRQPRLRRSYADAALSTTWIPPNDFARAFDEGAPETGATTYGFTLRPADWKRYLPGMAVLSAALAVMVWVSDLPFDGPGGGGATVQLSMDHRSGYPIAGIGVEGNPSREPPRLVLEIDGEVVLDRTYSLRGRGPAASAPVLEQIDFLPGTRRVKLTMFDRADLPGGTVLYDETVSLAGGEILNLEFEDAALGADPAAGRDLFLDTRIGANTGCRICHSLEPGQRLVGPSLAGVGRAAETRVPGLTAEEYLRRSIVEPDAYLVEGFQPGAMLPDVAEVLTEQQLDDLVAFLMTLR